MPAAQSPPLPPELAEKRDRLLDALRTLGRVAVAFSGGVDSAVVAKAAALACGEDAVAVTADSPSLASGELETASSVAAAIGIRHRVLRTNEFASPDYLANASDRCFHCKSELYDRLGERLSELNADAVVNGANADDVGDHRPGMRAASDRGVRSPLLECGVTKAEVRTLAKAWGLPVWDKPASPCLSSRIAYGVPVTEARVRRVDAAEAWLKERFDLRECRVRCEANDLARVEVPRPALPRVVGEAATVSEELRRLGFRYVTLDLEGFRSGSLNAALTPLTLTPPR
ncbi:ATP-dependent sacrificial sulfur transferase LarE [Alienimonas californiensis]|uniref:tRNA-specific 2-thiouridylase MnmA n=1 Tax=Alienimonas californiensis TaxID=2527989 RepID=A0A517PET5_9PLAN|nr:ATP-dependent sacrificial sulfur transferase LarE [Alienimonas californiensis]QDT17874.1 tRNA-specific 2-thiouridylase MnmA [Alienimonas californiensis]